MCDITNLIEDTSDAVEELLKDVRLATSKEFGLDERCPSLWVSENAVVCRGDTRRLEYYGAFEYVTASAKIGLGNYTVYLADRDETGRVWEVINRVLDEELEKENQEADDEWNRNNIFDKE